MYDIDGLGNLFFDIFPTLFIVVFVIIVGVIIVGAIGGVKQWSKNEQSPRLTVPAVVKAKRTKVSGHMHHHNNDFHNHTSTTYFVTFEFESGDRTEFHVSGKEYGYIADGDLGMITFQGTRFLGFERVNETIS